MSAYNPELPAKLAAFLQSKRNTPFAWGKNDCCLFTSDWIKILTGSDPAEAYRGKYDSALSAARVTEPAGGLSELVQAEFSSRGWQNVSVKLAMRGDAVERVAESGSMLGVCAGEQSAFPGAKGIVYIPTLQCVRAWRIV